MTRSRPRLRKRFVIVGVLVLAAAWLVGRSALNDGPPHDLWLPERMCFDGELEMFDAPGGCKVGSAGGFRLSSMLFVDLEPSLIARTLARVGLGSRDWTHETYMSTDDCVTRDGCEWRRFARCIYAR